ncbi:MAG: MaoC family dehydratase [Polyangiaceae bacterium]|nr:MaoC family dehydratase [Polyangiaceae bacterium]
MKPWGEWRVGDALETNHLGEVTRTDVVRYQGASGDMNPIHHDEPFARAAGYEAPLVVGMFQAGALCAWAAGIFGPERTRRARIRWQARVWPGDRLVFTGKVTARHEDAGESRVEVELACHKDDGELCVTAWMTFAGPPA